MAALTAREREVLPHIAEGLSNAEIAGHLDFDPGPGTASARSSFAAELTDAARQLLGQS